MIELPRTCPRHFCGVGRFCVVLVDEAGEVTRVLARELISPVPRREYRLLVEVTTKYPVQRLSLKDAEEHLRANYQFGIGVALI